MPELIQQTERGLYCEAGDFHIDPWQPVDRAVITHAHSDHARWGSRAYLAAAGGIEVLRSRLGPDAAIQGIPFNESIGMNDVRVSLHPAGHILGSAQVRVEYQGEVWGISGDYKLQTDPTCDAFEPVACHTFITESTFGLPIYRWKGPEEVFDEMNEWWRENQERRRTSIIYAYALGKAQRILASIDASIGPIIVHGAIARFLGAYEAARIKLPPTHPADPELVKSTRGTALVIAPPSAVNSPWLRKFGRQSSAYASGWMQVRGNRRRANVDRGFVLSDHVDWDGLLSTIRATGAHTIGVTHGYTDQVARYLNEHGINARIYHTRFSDRGEEALEPDESEINHTDTEDTEKNKELDS
ncbi:MAG: ligase-associated DNA damage response exonuclease [Phycisphaerales bacterium]|nr:ligase-associated DNA damage response exonuclease [Phycisphaerales bacterium]MCI0630307.1 ligase-associated DNA damage response exonuclease [Phycisphaerales bacterium]MCI0677300.1 ligase-associated DNA damage response exonuclease [Phycisphaerales bacterium]